MDHSDPVTLCEIVHIGQLTWAVNVPSELTSVNAVNVGPKSLVLQGEDVNLTS